MMSPLVKREVKVRRLKILLIVCFFGLSACGGGLSEKTGEVKANIKKASGEVMHGIPVELMNEELEMLPDNLLKKLLKKSEDRLEFLKGVYAEEKLSKAIKENNLDKNKRLSREIKVTINNIYIDELVRQYFDKRQGDLITLAKDRYDSNKEDYKVRRRIRIAQIYISKLGRAKEESKKLISNIERKLKSSEDRNFFKIADELSDKQPGSMKGGIFEKWLIFPGEGKKLNRVLAAAFNLKNVGDETEVIETGQGYHIIKLVEEVKGENKSFQMVKKSIVNEMRSELMKTIKDEVKASLFPPVETKYDDKLLREMLLEEMENRKNKVDQK